MKLGVLLDRFKGSGGAERHSADLVARAIAGGDEVALAVLRGGGSGVEVVEIPAPRRRPARDRVFAKAGVRALRERGCDVVLGVRHCPGVDVYLPHGGLVRDALAAGDHARGGGSALRRIARAASARHRFFLEAERALLGAEDGPPVICVSNRLAQRTKAVYPASAGRIDVVPNGVDAERFHPEAHADAGRTLRQRIGLDGAYVGLLLAHHPRLKGAQAAIEALARPEVVAIDPPFHLVVAGAKLRAALHRRAARLGVRDRLHELGPGRGADPLGRVGDPRPVYAAADVLVHPTFYDPCSLACLEALAMGVPVVTTPRNGVAELMKGRGGIVIEGPGRPDALAVAIRVLADRDLRAAAAADARTVAEAHPADRALDRVLEICRSACR